MPPVGVGVFLVEKSKAGSRDGFATSIPCTSVAKGNLAQAQVELARRKGMEPPNIALLDQVTKLCGGAPKGG